MSLPLRLSMTQQIANYLSQNNNDQHSRQQRQERHCDVAFDPVIHKASYLEDNIQQKK